MSRYRRHGFPIEVIEQCVWLYFHFALSYRNIEEMMAKRGVPVTYETAREWCQKFGSLYALLREGREGVTKLAAAVGQGKGDDSPDRP